MPRISKRNPDIYQTVNPDKLVSELTVEELQQEVCYQMDIIEALEKKLDEFKGFIQTWRLGREP